MHSSAHVTAKERGNKRHLVPAPPPDLSWDVVWSACGRAAVKWSTATPASADNLPTCKRCVALLDVATGGDDE